MPKPPIPDPLQWLRKTLDRVEGRANALAGRGLQCEPVLATLHRLNSASMLWRQALQTALDRHYKRLNLPTARDVAAIKATLQRIEDRLDSLASTHDAPTAQAPRPARTRKPAAVAPGADGPDEAAASGGNAPRRRAVRRGGDHGARR